MESGYCQECQKLLCESYGICEECCNATKDNNIAREVRYIEKSMNEIQSELANIKLAINSIREANKKISLVYNNGERLLSGM